MLIPLGYGIYKLLMVWDYNNLKHRIEWDIMNGYDKVYDYELSSYNEYKIENIDKIRHNHGSKSGRDDIMSSALLNSLYGVDWLQIAVNRNMLRYSDPPEEPFRITSIEKNGVGGYDVKQFACLGIGYKTSEPSYTSPIYDYLSDIDDPKQIYSDTFKYLSENKFSLYNFIDGSSDNIYSILFPWFKTVSYSRKGYDEVYTHSLFHYVNSQDKGGVSGRGCKRIERLQWERFECFYEVQEDYLQIYEHPFSPLEDIIKITFSVLIVLSSLILILYFPHIKNNLKLTGQIWVNLPATEALIFLSPIIGKPRIRIIKIDSDNTFTFKYSKDQCKILLSNGEIYSLIIQQNDENVECLELRKGLEERTLYMRY